MFDRALNIVHGTPKERGDECMSGSIYFRKDRGIYAVNWYHALHKRKYIIYRYRGELLYTKKRAAKLLSLMQADVENGTAL